MSQTSSVPSPGAGIGPAPLFRAHELLQRAHDTLASGDLIKRPFQASLIACDERDVTPLQRDIAEWLRRCEAEPGRVLIEFVTEILTGPDATSDACVCVCVCVGGCVRRLHRGPGPNAARPGHWHASGASDLLLPPPCPPSISL